MVLMMIVMIIYLPPFLLVVFWFILLKAKCFDDDSDNHFTISISFLVLSCLSMLYLKLLCLTMITIWTAPPFFLCLSCYRISSAVVSVVVSFCFPPCLSLVEYMIHDTGLLTVSFKETSNYCKFIFQHSFLMCFTLFYNRVIMYMQSD